MRLLGQRPRYREGPQWNGCADRPARVGRWAGAAWILTLTV